VKLITHIQNRLLDVIPAHLQEELGIVRISYEEVRKTLQDNAVYLEEEDHELEYFRENIS
jgi:predicted kinase